MSLVRKHSALLLYIQSLPGSCDGCIDRCWWDWNKLERNLNQATSGLFRVGRAGVLFSPIAMWLFDAFIFEWWRLWSHSIFGLNNFLFRLISLHQTQGKTCPTTMDTNMVQVPALPKAFCTAGEKPKLKALAKLYIPNAQTSMITASLRSNMLRSGLQMCKYIQVWVGITRTLRVVYSAASSISWSARE